MNVIRKSTWTILFLGVVIGCTTEEEAAPPPAAKPNYPAEGTKDAPPVSPPATGESKKNDEAPKIEGPKAENSKPDGAVVLTSEEIAAVKELPEAEQAAASKQGVCPVSTHNLGSMGKPIKVTAEGRTFYICCDSCEDKVKSDPKTVIANLDKKK
jgi:glucose/arabinose dehydrogenase